MSNASRRKIVVSEQPQIPMLSVVFGFGPVLLIAAGAVATWITSGAFRDALVLLTTTFAASILAFLAGVRRGLSFRTEGGPAAGQMATVIGLYALAIFSFLALVNGQAQLAAAATAVGFGLVLILDPIAARTGHAPLFFARLRPPQMLIAIAGLVSLAVRLAFQH